MRSTVAHGFEFKVLDGCGALARQLSGDCFRPFLMVLDAHGVPRSVHLEDPRERAGALEELDPTGCRLFYDPFEAPEWTFIRWTNLPRRAMERLLDARFSPDDFGPGMDAFPSTWRVMF